MTSISKQNAGRAVWVGIILAGSLLMGASLAPLPKQEAAPAQAAGQGGASDAHSEFPAGPGRDTTLSKCSKCHSPDNIIAMGRDRQGWQDIVSKMVDLGASGTDEEFTGIIDYLSKSFPASAVPRVNVNSATASQIAAVLTLTADEAKLIVDYRDKNGKYKTFEDLLKVPSLDAKKLEAKKTSVVL